MANSLPFIHYLGNCQRHLPSSLHLLLRTPKTASIMSNTISDNLHRLIKSMSKPEKRYFKVFCSRHIIGDENNYEVLFDAIDKQEVYDEEKLLRKFKGKGFTERFSIAKNRLYGAILKSLDAFHSNSSVEAQLHRQLHAVEILYNKSLYDQSLKLLHSARKVAEKHELFLVLGNIARWEKRILEKDQYESVKDATEIESMLVRDESNRREMQLADELWSIKSRMFFRLYREGKARSEQESEHFNALVAQVRVLSEQAQSITNKQLLAHLSSAYHFSVGEYSDCYPHLLENISLMQAHPHLFEEEPTALLSALSNAVYVGLRLGKKEEAAALLAQMRAHAHTLLEHGSEDLQTRIFTVVHSTELTLFAQSGNFEAGLEVLPAIAQGLEKYGENISSIRRAHFYFNIAVIHFGLEQYKEASRWINRLLNQVDIDKTRDVHCMAQILHLIIQFELGNTALIPYTMRSTQRFLETRKKAFRFETVLLDFLNEMLKKRPAKSNEALWDELVQQLETLHSDPMENNVFEYFDFLAWARSRVEKKKYRELIAA